MSKSLLLLFLSIAASGIVSAATLQVSASGQFAGSDISDPLAAPNGQFALSFVVDSNPTPLSGTITSLGFDVPVSAFSYKLNGSTVSAAPSEIRFNTLANGGLFDVTFGSGLSAYQFIFEGVQAFSGPTSTPIFSVGSYTLSSWTYSAPANYDPHTASAAVSISATPEPSSLPLILCGFAGLTAAMIRKPGCVR